MSPTPRPSSDRIARRRFVANEEVGEAILLGQPLSRRVRRIAVSVEEIRLRHLCDLLQRGAQPRLVRIDVAPDVPGGALSSGTFPNLRIPRLPEAVEACLLILSSRVPAPAARRLRYLPIASCTGGGAAKPVVPSSAHRARIGGQRKRPAAGLERRH